MLSEALEEVLVDFAGELGGGGRVGGPGGDVEGYEVGEVAEAVLGGLVGEE